MIKQGYYGSKGGFHPYRKPTVYVCPKCGYRVELRLVRGRH